MYKVTAKQILEIRDAVNELLWLPVYRLTDTNLNEKEEIKCIQYVLEQGYSTLEEIHYHVKQYYSLAFPR